MDFYLTKLWEQFAAHLPNILAALAIFAGSIFVAKLLRKILKKVLKQHQVNLEITQLLCQVLYWSIVTIGMITALGRFFDITAFLAGLGILGFTIGFALQNVMQNFVSGIILLIQQPFKVGELVQIAGYDGNVQEINIRSTEVRTLDGRIVLIPNVDILAQSIINYSRAKDRRIELSVGIAYNTNLEAARQILLESVTSIPGYIEQPAPKILFHTFDSSSINLSVHFWIDPQQNNVFDAKDMALTRVKIALAKHGIEIPYPIRVIYTHTQK